MPQVFELYERHYHKYQIRFKFTIEELEQQLMPVDETVYTLVYDDPVEKKITAFISIYNLPQNVLIVNQLYAHYSLNHGHVYLYAYQNRLTFQELFKYALAFSNDETASGFKFDTVSLRAYGKGFKIAARFNLRPSSHFEHFYMFNFEPKGSSVCISTVNAPIV